MPRSAQDGRPPSPDLFADEPFPGFGPSRFHPDGQPPGGRLVRGRTDRKLRHAVRQHAPKTPGVYGMLDRRGKIIYVGKAKSLRARLLSYFRENSRDPKAGKIIQHTRSLVWEHAANELAALLRELELIQRLRPRYNVLGVPGRQRYVYVCLAGGPAPYFYVGRDPDPKDLAAYGPFVGRSQAEAAVRRLNDYFKLRDCADRHPVRFADQKELFPLDRGAACLRHELGTCLGPCAGACTRRGYAAAVQAARAFLDGADRSLLGALTKQMTAAAKAMEYERASAVRDKLADFEWLDLRLTLLRRSRDQEAFVYPLAGPDGRAVWYVLNRGQVWAATLAPADADARARAAARIAEIAAAPMTGGGSRCVDSVLLVAAWFRRNAGEKAALRPAGEVLAELRG
jgi:excinuclease ABC subunit C